MILDKKGVVSLYGCIGPYYDKLLFGLKVIGIDRYRHRLVEMLVLRARRYCSRSWLRNRCKL